MHMIGTTFSHREITSQLYKEKHRSVIESEQNVLWDSIRD